MKRILTLVAVGLMAGTLQANAQVMLQKVVIAAGGNEAHNASAGVNMTVGQAVIGVTSSSQVRAELGFWTADKPAGSVADKTATEDKTIQAWPNPASGLTKIQVSLPASDELDVRLYDLTGREVKQIFSGVSRTDSRAFDVNLSDLASGTYIVAARVPGELVEKTISVQH